jgi:hypothetical protein
LKGLIQVDPKIRGLKCSQVARSSNCFITMTDKGTRSPDAGPIQLLGLLVVARYSECKCGVQTNSTDYYYDDVQLGIVGSVRVW